MKKAFDLISGMNIIGYVSDVLSQLFAINIKSNGSKVLTEDLIKEDSDVSSPESEDENDSTESDTESENEKSDGNDSSNDGNSASSDESNDDEDTKAESSDNDTEASSSSDTESDSDKEIIIARNPDSNYMLDEEWFFNKLIMSLVRFLEKHDVKELSNNTIIDNRKLIKARDSNKDLDIGKSSRLFEGITIYPTDVKFVVNNESLFNKSQTRYMYSLIKKDGTLDLRTEVELKVCVESALSSPNTLNTCNVLEQTSGIGQKFFVKDIPMNEFQNILHIKKLDPKCIGKHVGAPKIWSYDETNGVFSVGYEYKEMTLGQIYLYNKRGDLSLPLKQLTRCIFRLKELDLVFGDVKTNNAMINVEFDDNNEPVYNVELIDWESLGVRPVLKTKKGKIHKYIAPGSYMSYAYTNPNHHDYFVDETVADMFQLFIVIVDCLIFLTHITHVKDVYAKSDFLSNFRNQMFIGKAALLHHLSAHYKCRASDTTLITLVNLLYKLHDSCMDLKYERVIKYIDAIYDIVCSNSIVIKDTDEGRNNAQVYKINNKVFKYTNRELTERESFHTPREAINYIGLFKEDHKKE